MMTTNNFRCANCGRPFSRESEEGLLGKTFCDDVCAVQMLVLLVEAFPEEAHQALKDEEAE